MADRICSRRATRAHHWMVGGLQRTVCSWSATIGAAPAGEETDDTFHGDSLGWLCIDISAHDVGSCYDGRLGREARC